MDNGIHLNRLKIRIQAFPDVILVLFNVKPGLIESLDRIPGKSKRGASVSRDLPRMVDAGVRSHHYELCGSRLKCIWSLAPDPLALSH